MLLKQYNIFVIIWIKLNKNTPFLEHNNENIKYEVEFGIDSQKKKKGVNHYRLRRQDRADGWEKRLEKMMLKWILRRRAEPILRLGEPLLSTPTWKKRAWD